MPLEDSNSSVSQSPAAPVSPVVVPQTPIAPIGNKKIRPINISKHGLFFLSVIAVIFLIVLVFLLMEKGKTPPASTVSKSQVKASIPVKISEEPLDVNKPEVLGRDLDKITGVTPEKIDGLKKGFYQRDWPNAKTDIQKMMAYMGVYGSLWGYLNNTGDPSVLAEMKKIESFIYKTWPDQAKIIASREGFKK